MNGKVDIDDIIKRINGLPSIDKYLVKEKEKIKYLNEDGSEIPIDVIFSTPELGIMIASMPNGRFPFHEHEFSVEVGIIISGTGYAEITFEDGETKRLNKGEPITFQKGVKHEWNNIGESKVLFITVPKDKGYP